MLASTVFLQPYPVAAGEIGRAVVSSVLSLDEYLLQTDILSARNFVTSRCIIIFDPSLTAYAMINDPRTAANDFNAKNVPK